MILNLFGQSLSHGFSVFLVRLLNLTESIPIACQKVLTQHWARHYKIDPET